MNRLVAFLTAVFALIATYCPAPPIPPPPTNIYPYVQVGYNGTDGYVLFYSEDGATDHWGKWAVPTMTGNVTFYFPATQPAAGILSIDASGNLTSGAGNVTAGNITISGETISSNTGNISFSNENLTTTGTISGLTVTGTTSGVFGNLTMTGANLTSDTGAISFDNEDLSTSGNLTVGNITISGAGLSSDTSAISFGAEDLSTTGNLTVGNLTLSGDDLTSGTGNVDFADDNLVTTGSGTFGNVVLSNGILATTTAGGAAGAIPTIKTSRSTVDSPTKMIANDYLVRRQVYGYYPSAYGLAFEESLNAFADFSAADLGVSWQIATCASGSNTTVTRLRLDETGNFEVSFNLELAGDLSVGGTNATIDSASGNATFGVLTAATGSAVGNLSLANGSITDASGAISFGDENLTTTGTLSTGNISTSLSVFLFSNLADSGDLTFLTGSGSTNTSNGGIFGITSGAGYDAAGGNVAGVGGTVTVQAGAGGDHATVTAMPGGGISLTAGHGGNTTSGAPGNGGAITILGGTGGEDAGGTDGTGGAVSIDAGSGGPDSSGGSLNLGTTYASSVNISRAGVLTTIAGGTLVCGSTFFDGMLRLWSAQTGTDYSLDQYTNTAMTSNMNVYWPPDEPAATGFMQMDTGGNITVVTSGTMTSLTVGNITISGDTITSDTGNVSFGDDNGVFGNVTISTTGVASDPAMDMTFNAGGKATVSGGTDAELSAVGNVTVSAAGGNLTLESGTGNISCGSANITTTGNVSFGEFQATGVVANLTFADPGTSANSYDLIFTADNGGTALKGSLGLIYGADPYLRLSVDDDSASPALTAALDLHDTIMSFGTGTAGVDYVFTFNGESADGNITFMEDEARFDFNGDVNVATGKMYKINGTNLAASDVGALANSLADAAGDRIVATGDNTWARQAALTDLGTLTGAVSEALVSGSHCTGYITGNISGITFSGMNEGESCTLETVNQSQYDVTFTGIEEDWTGALDDANADRALWVIRRWGYRYRASCKTLIDDATVLLLHCNQADANTTFTDSADDDGAPHTMTAQGNAQGDTGITKLGAGTMLLDGTGDYVEAPDSNDWRLGYGLGNRFTIDFWVYPANVSIGSCAIAQGNTTTKSWLVQSVNTDGGRWEFFASSDGSTWDIANGVSCGNMSLTTWQHYAVVRDGTALRTYKDGTMVTDTTCAGDVYASAEKLYIGWENVGNVTFNGNLDEIRISNGQARWPSGNFTVRTTEY